MNSIATFGLAAIVLFALATGLAVNARAAENYIYTGNGDVDCAVSLAAYRMTPGIVAGSVA